MKNKFHLHLIASVFFLLIASPLVLFAQGDNWQFVNGDPLPDAPELAARGEYAVGVRTAQIVHKGQVDILNLKDGVAPLYDRDLKLEIWYPAVAPENVSPLINYEEERGVMNDPQKRMIKYHFTGKAFRDATPDIQKGPFPLIIVSPAQ